MALFVIVTVVVRGVPAGTWSSVPTKLSIAQFAEFVAVTVPPVPVPVPVPGPAQYLSPRN